MFMGKGLFVGKKVISIQFSKNNMLQGMATYALFVWSYLTTQTSIYRTIEKLEEIIKNDNTKKPTTKRPNSNKKTNKSNKHE